EPIRKKAVETNKEDALKRLIEAMCVERPNGYTDSYIDNYKDREDFHVEDKWDIFRSAHDIAFFGESDLVINSLLDVFINDIRGSHLDFNQKAVELYDWVHEPDTGLHENRREALELLLANLATKNTELFLDKRKLNTVPAILNEYTWLTTLSLGDNRLTELPDLSELPLQKVSLENNLFAAIPFELPLSLTKLNMRNNFITQTNSTLESLSENCQVDLSGNPISEDTIIRINRILNAPDYHGPRILFSMQSEPVVHSLFPIEPTLPEVLAKWEISETLAAWII
ncbi:Ipa, partial [Candidatus Regiella insecticola 5.15]